MRTLIALLFTVFCVAVPTASNAGGYGSFKDAGPVYSRCAPGAFSGFHLGIQGAYASHDNDFSARYGTFDGNFSTSSDAGAIGYTSGYDYQCGRFVIGYESDTSWAWIDHETTHANRGAPAFRTSHEIDWLSTYRGRLGLTWNENWLLYFTGGAARAKISQQVLDLRGRQLAEFKDWRWGYALGGGIEYAHSSRLSFKAEGLYIDFADDDRRVLGSDFEINDEIVLARIGVNYRMPKSPLALLLGW